MDCGGGARKMSRASEPRPQSSRAALLIQSREHIVSARWLMADVVMKEMENSFLLLL